MITWLPGTLHLVAAAGYRWLHALDVTLYVLLPVAGGGT
jgi:hypothetical protein